MTAQEYKNAGYNISSLISQATIDRAETDIKQAYIEPIIGDGDSSAVAVVDALQCLSYLLILKRNIFATRSGAKEKQTPQSYTPEQSKVLQELCSVCDMKLQALRRLDGANRDAAIHDICGIYFITNYFYNN